MQPLGPTAAHRFPRKKPNKILPSDKISFSRQLEVLRAWALASAAEDVVVSNEAVAVIVGMNASTLSLLNSFFANVGFLRKSGAGYLPSSEVLQFNQNCAAAGQNAAYALAPLLKKTWFARAILPHLAYEPMEHDTAIRLLAEAASMSPDDRLVLLLD
jgi:hypothetical protein